MSASQLQHNGSSPVEIIGKPGQVWGTMVIPAGGKTTMRINGDILQTSTRVNYGLENKEVLTRIQNIDSIEVTEGLIWWLLIIGLITLSFLIGVVFIVLFFVIKQKWLVIHTSSAALILFHNNTQQARDFRDKLMIISRQLNSKTFTNSSSSSKSMPSARNA